MKGPWIDSSAVLLGGLAGAALGTKISERVRTALPLTFGLCSMGLGIALTVQVKHLAAMVLSLVLGALIGELVFLERGIGKASERLRAVVDRIFPRSADAGESEAEYLRTFVAVLVLFCASGTGIFGSMKEGMTGDASVLIAKSLLDFFTAGIFATQLGYAVAAVAVPQLLIQLSLGYGAVFILPLTTPVLVADFSAVGGLIMFATGLRICKIKELSVANMLPALVLAMPLSALWLRLFHI
jgi:uncharacterized membrane protein YqgA involved in biofilm formation